MDTNTSFRCGVIGVGHLGKRHAQKYAEITEITLFGVADIDADAGRATASLYNCKSYTNYKEMLPHLDIASVVVPTELHHEIASECLRHGVHVLLEKPITRTVAEADELIALAKQHNCKLQVGHLERYNPAAIDMKRIITQPQSIQVTRVAPFSPRAADVSVILDLMIHDIEIVQYWLQSEVVKITASGMRMVSKHIDYANAVLEFENGCIAALTASRISIKRERTARIYQAGKYYSVDFMNKALATFTEVEDREDDKTSPYITAHQDIFGESDAIKEEICDLIAAIGDDMQPTVDGTIAREALKIAIDIANAIETRNSHIKQT